MALLNTPHHQCESMFVNGPHCPYAAYKRFEARWLCKGCTCRARAKREITKPT